MPIRKMVVMAATAAVACGHTMSREPFQYDYCSYVHSQHVIDRVESEVKPIFEKYGVAMVQSSDQCAFNNFGAMA